MLLTAERWQVLAWDVNPREREKIDSKSREATAGVGFGRMAAHLSPLQGFPCPTLYFTWDLHPRLALAVPIGTKDKLMSMWLM